MQAQQRAWQLRRQQQQPQPRGVGLARQRAWQRAQWAAQMHGCGGLQAGACRQAHPLGLLQGRGLGFVGGGACTEVLPHDFFVTS